MKKVLSTTGRFCMTMLILFIISVGCNASYSQTDWRFEGQKEDLLLSASEMPPGWTLEQEGTSLQADVPNVHVIYDTELDTFLTNSLISHEIIVFDQPKEASELIEEDYQMWLDLAKEVIEPFDLQWDDFSPLPEHTYSSPLADEFRVLYYPEMSVMGPMVGFHYTVWARYGNVVSIFATIIEDEELTQISAETANVIPWGQVEQLLETIDQRFAEAGKFEAQK
ncbi:MAG TPA: hypothetical protein PKE64_27085 [Anaerolineae bacterium]|nr:hypothetical protein [Anaerolineae bacterium]